MRRTVALLRWEARLQRRYMSYAITAIVAVVRWSCYAFCRPRPSPILRPSYLFVLTNLQITSSYFAAALVLLERGRGVLAAHLVSPLNADQPAGVPEGAGQRAASGRRGSRGVTTPQDSSCVADRSSPWLVYI